MTPREKLGVFMAAVIAFLALTGSISGLVAYAMAGEAQTIPIRGHDFPIGVIAFVAGIDLLALTLTTWAHDHTKRFGIDWGPAVVLAMITGFSGTLQYIHAPMTVAGKIVHTWPSFATVVAAGFAIWKVDKAKQRARKPNEEAKTGSVRTGAAASPDRAEEVPSLPPPPVGNLDVDGGATPIPIGTARRKGGRRSATSASPPLSRDEILRQLHTYFTEQNIRPTKQSVRDVVKTQICGTLEHPGRCSDRTILEYLSELNEQRRTGS